MSPQMGWIGRLIGIKMDKQKLIVGIILPIILLVLLTYGVTRSITEKKVLENINIAFQQCEKTCGFNKPAFTSVDGKTLDCICLEFDYGNSTNDIIQG